MSTFDRILLEIDANSEGADSINLADGSRNGRATWPRKTAVFLFVGAKDTSAFEEAAL